MTKRNMKGVSLSDEPIENYPLTPLSSFGLYSVSHCFGFLATSLFWFTLRALIMFSAASGKAKKQS